MINKKQISVLIEATDKALSTLATERTENDYYIHHTFTCKSGRTFKTTLYKETDSYKHVLSLFGRFSKPCLLGNNFSGKHNLHLSTEERSNFVEHVKTHISEASQQ